MVEQTNISDFFYVAKNVLRGWWRFRWTSIGIAWIIGLTGWAFTLSTPDIYEARTRIYVDTQSTLRPLLRGLTVDTDVYSDIEVMSRAILSTPSLQKIISKTLLYSKDGREAPIEQAIVRLRSNALINLDRQDNLTITFRHQNPTTALWVLETLLDDFIEGALGANREDTDSAQFFLEAKINEYDAKLNEAEKRLADFKKRSIGMLPGAEGDYYRRLQNEMDRLSALEIDLQLAERRRDEISRQIQGETPVFGMSPSGSGGAGPSPYDAQIAGFEGQLNQLRLNFTDSHPDVVRIKELIADLRATRAAENVDITDQGSSQGGMLERNPVYQQMKIVLSSTEVELSQLQSRVASQRRLVQDLKQKVDTIPDIEAELTRLNRDYETNEDQYDQLVRRLEQARLSEDAEANKSNAKFRVIDPPAVPSSPVSPNRGLLMAFSLFLAIIGGIGAGVLRSLLTPVFYSARNLEKAYGVSVLGTISQYRSPAEIASLRMAMILFVVSVSCLMAVYGVLLVFDQASIRLVTQVTNFIG